MTKLRSLFALSLIAIFALAFTACGGGDDGDDAAAELDPTEVLEATFGTQHETTSGVFGMTASVDVPGDEGGSGSFTLSAPFNNNGEGEIPDLDLSFDVEAEGAGQSFDFAAGGTLTPDGATINFNDTDYEVPAELFDVLAQGIAEATEQSQSAADLGFDPLTWFTGVTNEGSEEIDGTETVHISGNADVTAIGEDVLKAVQEAGIPGTELPPGFDASQLSLLEGFIEEASFDVYSEEDGNLLRQIDVTIALQNLAAASGGAGPDSASFEISVTIDEPGEEQTIELPDETESLEQLQADLEAEFGDVFGGLGALGAGGAIPGLPGGSGAGGGGAAIPGSGGGSGAGGGDIPGVNQQYLDCLQGAATPEALEKCAEDL